MNRKGEKVKRLKQHFLRAETITASAHESSLKQRSAGFEVETLFVDSTTGRPITRETAQNIFVKLVLMFGWKIEEVKNSILVRISHTHSTDGVLQYKHELIYELGWNNIELITPPWFVSFMDVGIRELLDRLNELYTVAKIYGAESVKASYDGFENDDTLMMPDKRDEIWKELDGPVLPVLGHIASVHYNIDLASVNEGMEWIGKIAGLREKNGWPGSEPERIWKHYLAESHAGYEQNRYAMTPARDFDEYCRKLASYKVMMDRANDAPERIRDPRPFNETPDIDVELYLRSVWWGARLRVRGGRLVLEIRDVPRGHDSEIRQNFEILRRELGF